MDTIGKRIRYARKTNKLSLTEIKERTGISTGNMSELENDKFFPSSSSLIAFRNLFNISIDWLLTGEPPMTLPDHQNKKEVPPHDLSNEERELIKSFKKLDQEKQRDIKGFIQVISTINESLEEKTE